MDRGQLGALSYTVQRNQPLSQQPILGQQQTVAPEGFELPDKLAIRREALNKLLNDYGTYKNFLSSMSQQGIDPFKIDYSSPDGGLAYQAMTDFDAAIRYQAQELAAQAERDKSESEAVMRGDIRYNSSYDPSKDMSVGMNPRDVYFNTEADPIAAAANQRTADNYYTQGQVQDANQKFYHPAIEAIQRDPSLSPEAKAYKIAQAQQAIQQSDPYAHYSNRGGGSGANAGIAAYVKKFSQIANGLGFEPGDTFDTQGNRIDTYKPSEFVGRQMGFGKDGKPFIISRFERIAQPEGGFIVQAVSNTGDVVPVDPQNITGSLRSFIETNEGAAALKDLNSFFQSEGLNTAVEAVPANLYAPRTEDISAQTKIAPQVNSIRETISTSLDSLAEGGIGTFFGNAIATARGKYGDIVPTELEYNTSDGKKLLVKKDGDNYKIANYKDLFGKPDKSGSVTINGKKYNVAGTFEKVSKQTLQAMLEKYGVINVKLRDKEGKEIATSQAKKKAY